MSESACLHLALHILLYGVENEHYILTEDGQIKRERQDYIIDPNYIGNAFIAKTLYDENDDPIMKEVPVTEVVEKEVHPSVDLFFRQK